MKPKPNTLPKKRSMRLHLRCPNCQTPTIAYKVEWKSPTLTQLTNECQNELCGMRYVSYNEAVRILQPPTVVINPDLRPMKISKLAQACLKSETLNLLEVSDDESDLDLIDEAMPQTDLFYRRE